MQFRYKGIRENGEVFEGTVDAKDRFAVYGEVRKLGGSLLSVKEDRGVLAAIAERLNALVGRVSMSEKMLLLRNMSAMLSAGLPISRALVVMERQSKNSKLKRILRSLNESVEKGVSFHETLQKFPRVFSPFLVAMVRVGEESGTLAESLKLVSEQMERTYILTRRIRGAMIYPSVILIAMLVIGVLMLAFVVPTLTQTFTELKTELPLSTRVVIGLSAFFAEYTFVAAAGFVLAIVLLISLLRTKSGKYAFDSFILKIPVIKTIAREANTARTARTLSSLLSAGVDIVSALEITRAVVQNSRYRRAIARVEKGIEERAEISEAFKRTGELYPPLMEEMVAVGEETGRLAGMLAEVADFYESEVEQKTRDVSTIIEPVLMIVIGAVVGFFAYSMILPIYSISSAGGV